MKLTKSYLKQIIAEELLPEGIVRITSDIDADFRGDMVQLISSTGRLPLDVKSLRYLLSLVRQYVSRTLEGKITEGKRFTLPNGIKIELDILKGIILTGGGNRKVVMKRPELATFIKAMKKHYIMA